MSVNEERELEEIGLHRAFDICMKAIPSTRLSLVIRVTVLHDVNDWLRNGW